MFKNNVFHVPCIEFIGLCIYRLILSFFLFFRDFIKFDTSFSCSSIRHDTENCHDSETDSITNNFNSRTSHSQKLDNGFCIFTSFLQLKIITAYDKKKCQEQMLTLRRRIGFWTGVNYHRRRWILIDDKWPERMTIKRSNQYFKLNVHYK